MRSQALSWYVLPRNTGNPLKNDKSVSSDPTKFPADRKQHSLDNTNMESDSDTDEVEFLFTILPPSPIEIPRKSNPVITPGDSDCTNSNANPNFNITTPRVPHPSADLLNNDSPSDSSGLSSNRGYSKVVSEVSARLPPRIEEKELSILRKTLWTNDKTPTKIIPKATRVVDTTIENTANNNESVCDKSFRYDSSFTPSSDGKSSPSAVSETALVDQPAQNDAPSELPEVHPPPIPPQSSSSLFSPFSLQQQCTRKENNGNQKESNATAKTTTEQNNSEQTMVLSPQSIEQFQVDLPLSNISGMERDNLACNNIQAATKNSKTSDSVSTNQQFSARNSAYLQSLAEICHTILWDRRWRVGGTSKQQQLFAWEYGDDLSAVCVLSRRYIKPLDSLSSSKENENTTVRNLRQSCVCLMCDGHLNGKNSRTRQECTKDVDYLDSSVSREHLDQGETETTRCDEGNVEDLGNDNSEAYDRALNLYCRLYSRKGPWFRIDSLFKYYLPPQRDSNSRPEDNSNNDEEKTTPRPSSPSEAHHSLERVNEKVNDEEIHVNMPPSHGKQSTPKSTSSQSGFFSPRRASGQCKKPIKSTSRGGKELIDVRMIDALLTAAETLLEDLHMLYRMGLIRTFYDEKECGLSVGETRKFSLLKQDEQHLLLSKLGGGKNKKKPFFQSPSPRSLHRTGDVTDNINSDSDNLIWKQMSRQKSISSLMATVADLKAKKKSESVTCLLPVLQHVDDILLQSWSTSIVLKSSRVDYLPSAILQEVSGSVKAHLMELTAKKYSLEVNSSSNPHVGGASKGNQGRSLLTCVRLREAPLKTLHRCCRLYLCATSGPGDMRGDSMNAWRSLPNFSTQQRSDGDSVGDISFLQDLPITQIAPRPGSFSWHNVSYPGRDYRFKLRSFNFIRAYQPLLVGCADGDESSEGIGLSAEQSKRLQVFQTLDCFHLWELCVEVRANVDYLIELNDIVRYNQRKRAREESNEEQHESDHCAGSGNDSSSSAANEVDAAEIETTSGLDFLNVLTKDGRDRLFRKLCSVRFDDCFGMRSVAETKMKLEGDVALLLGSEGDDHSTRTGKTDTKRLMNECEKILATFAVISIHVLAFRSQSVSQDESSFISSRPWLRHLRWEGCLAYSLWDIIPVLEKLGFYRIVIKALEVLLFGHELPRDPGDCAIPSSFLPMEFSTKDTTTSLPSIYLSRRARGKAYERLLIDYVHLLRRQKLKLQHGECPRKTGKRRTQKETCNSPTVNELSAKLCEQLLQMYVPTGQITFCAARTLARRLKQPLSRSLSGIELFEPGHLGHRLCNSVGETTVSRSSGKITLKEGKYIDWTPITDFAVANSMSSGDNTVGKRCSYVGFEEKEESNYSSLNVEELAMEFYYTGRLPEHDCSCSEGGWVGWHDEGGKTRALFRVLSSAAILGMDWGCQDRKIFTNIDWATVHVTPYQSAPFDLHVGAEAPAYNGAVPNGQGFYFRREPDISIFLEKLSRLTPDDLTCLVYNSIESRLSYARLTGYNDPSLERDIQQVRTLSFLAAGFGGAMLAAIFRCFFFDYRHYSGGLPDLLLVRALYADARGDENNQNNEKSELVDLGEWVGENFSREHQSEEQAIKAINMVEDRDDEFLGCSKVGDSGGYTANSLLRKKRRQSLQARQEGSKPKTLLEMPMKLDLSHNGKKVRAECMLVEVKSQNDRLDARQEDWLNILDRYGNARVCKFGAVKKSKEGKKPKQRQSGIEDAKIEK